MLRLSPAEIEHLEGRYPGIGRQIRQCEAADLPACPDCQSTNTALVQIGLIGRTMQLATATSKVALIANGPKPGTYRCGDCEQFFF